MCNYWYLILTLQVDFLLYIHSVRESNVQFYVSSIKNLVKWIFAFNHYHHHVGTVDFFDLMSLPDTCQDIYRTNDFRKVLSVSSTNKTMQK